MPDIARRARPPVRPAALVLLPLLAGVLSACSQQTPTPPTPVTSPVAGTEAVVIVSGLATQTPYTTTAQACESGLSAGNTASALRDSLVAAGDQVFTAPTQTGTGQVTDTQGVGASSDCPPPLPQQLTIDTTKGIRNIIIIFVIITAAFTSVIIDVVGDIR